jgi:hypothetical protein
MPRFVSLVLCAALCSCAAEPAPAQSPAQAPAPVVSAEPSAAPPPTASAVVVPAVPPVPWESGELVVASAFERGSDRPTLASEISLRLVSAALIAHPDASVRVEAGGDPPDDKPARGPAAKGPTLAQRRALSLARWLVAQGADCRRLSLVAVDAPGRVAFLSVLKSTDALDACSP